ncbi:Panacea domain-containing protein [Azospirillum sp. sgz301742]
MPNHSSKAIANYFLDRARSEGRFLTTMNVLKLVYIAHGWTLALTDLPLIQERVEAWRHGPVIRELWDEFKVYGSGPIRAFADGGQGFSKLFLQRDWENESSATKESLTPSESNILDAVWNSYKNFNAFQLSAMTHVPGTPWSNVYIEGLNSAIENDDIKNHYRELHRARSGGAGTQ